MTKKEYKIEYDKSVNGAWEGSAYLVDPINMKRYCITVCAMPGEKAKIAKPFIKERLDLSVQEFIESHLTYIRVDVEEWNKYPRGVNYGARNS